MWVKICTNFGDDVYINLASMDEETRLEVLPGSFDNVPDVQHLENKDSIYMIVADSLHRLLCEVHGDALWRKWVPLGGWGLDEMGMLSILFSANLALRALDNVVWIPMLNNALGYIFWRSANRHSPLLIDWGCWQVYNVFDFCVSLLFFSLLCCIVFIVCMYMMLSYMEEINNLSIYLSSFIR